MAIDVLSSDLTKDIEQMKKEKENTIGCHIKVDNGLVKVTIPKKFGLLAIGSEPVTDEIILTFSKREIKELLQDIYVS